MSHVLGSKLGHSVSHIVDTFKVANEVFDFWARSLRDLLTRLECPFDQLHSAGNNANYTLKATLVLAAEGFHSQQVVNQLRHVALSPATVATACYNHERKTGRSGRRRARR